ncbi:MAG: hypothetical protein WDZ52_08010 [Pseudohongiellaceae bacterium]
MEERQTMIIDGITLEIVAHKLSDHEWELSVVNGYGISSVWNEFFESAEAALKIGRKTIENEGVESFLDTEGFEYLFDE